MKGIYCLYDLIAEQSGPLFTCNTDGEAVRAVKRSNKGQDMSEFRLVKLGMMDESNCCINGVIHQSNDIQVDAYENTELITKDVTLLDVLNEVKDEKK